MGKIVSVISGCGGVGKSTLAVSAAVISAQKGKSVILLDAAGVSRACDLMLGMESIVVIDMLDVLNHEASLQNALYPVPGIRNLRYASASLYEGSTLSELSGLILALRTMCDLLIIDLPTGPVRLNPELLDSNDALLLLTRPDDISVRSLERTLSAMPDFPAQRHLIINRLDPVLAKKKIHYSAQSVEMMLDIPVSCVLNEDTATISKNRKQEIEVRSAMHSQISRLIDQIL